MKRQQFFGLLSKQKKVAFPVGFLILFGTLFLGGACTPSGEGSSENGETRVSKPTVGYPAPDFTLLDINGESITLSENKGKVLMVNFWATWCTPCRVEMPSMEALYQQFDRNEFEILTVSSDFEGARVVEPFFKSLKLTFPALIDNNQRITELYQVRSLPSTYIIDQNGIITHRFLGAKYWDEKKSKDLIRKLIKTG